VNEVYITSERPRQVAEEVDSARRGGCTVFRLRSIDGGGMLDRERLGAARYAAGVQSVVELVPASPAAATARRR
jgi:hypothetical protein